MKWEYLIVKVHKDLEKREFAFTFLGNEGWEFMTIDEGIAYFKRPVPISLTSPNDFPLSDEVRAKMKVYFEVDDAFVDAFEEIATGVKAKIKTKNENG